MLPSFRCAVRHLACALEAVNRTHASVGVTATGWRAARSIFERNFATA